MKRTVFLIVLLALLVGAGNVGAQEAPTPWRVYLPTVGRHCTDLGNSPITRYEISPPGIRVQVHPNDACTHVEVRVFYRSAEFPAGIWTYWGPADWPNGYETIVVDYHQDVGGGLVRQNEIIEFRDLTGHGYTTVRLDY